MPTDTQLHDRIREAEAARRVEIGVELRRLNRPDSPVFGRWDNAVPAFVLIAAVVAAFVFGGWLVALATAASGLVLMLTTVNLAVMSLLRWRALDMALSGPEGWERLWAIGGLTLRLPRRPDTECKGPDGDWRAFVRRHLTTEAEAAE